MIIQIRGTSGSGKSTVMRRVMEGIGDWFPVTVPSRKKPLYYNSREYPELVVLGHYESPCGGGDTIGSARAIYDLIQQVKLEGFEHVICEGLLLSEDVKWSSQMEDLQVVFLTTSLDQCLDWIKTRRESVGNLKPLNPANTSNRVAVIERARRKLLDLGITCIRASANQAPSVILKWIREGI